MRQRLLFVLLALLARSAIAAKATVDPLEAVIAAIQKKDVKKVQEAVLSGGVSVNTYSEKGQFPIVQAARANSLPLVQLLVDYGCSVQVQEPKGDTACHAAFQNDNFEMSRLLLRLGCNANATNGAGTTARSLTKNKEILKLLSQVDREGAMALEDPPGSWLKQASKGAASHAYWYNSKTSASQWSAPPECAWRREVKGDAHPVFINEVTGQQVHRTPPALAWRALSRKDGGAPYWYNWVTEKTQHETPAEIPEAELPAYLAQIDTVWVNSVTGESSWEDPMISAAPGWRKVYDEKEGRSFWFHEASGKSSWDPPAELAWEEVQQGQDKYYHNAQLQQTAWEVPQPLAWTAIKSKHDEL